MNITKNKTKEITDPPATPPYGIATQSGKKGEQKKQKKVLIVEDDLTLLSMYQFKFKREKFDVYTASDGEPAIQIAKEQHPDIILLDIVLNDSDGFFVLQKLKNIPETSKIPVLMISNLGSRQDMDHAAELGANGYLIKAHTTPEELVQKVREELEKTPLN